MGHNNHSRLTAGAILLAAIALSSCGTKVEASRVPTASREVGVPASDRLEDLNQWKGDVAVISGDISFLSGSAELTSDGEIILRELVEHLENTSRPILIEGFADGVGGDGDANNNLSVARAEAVQKWFLENTALPDERFLPTKGYGVSGEVNGVKAIDGVSDERRRVVSITVVEV